MHPASDNVKLMFNLSTDSGSNYNVTKTSTMFNSYHNEAGNDQNVVYNNNNDLAQSTNNQPLADSIGNDNDQVCSGYLKLFNPSSTVFVKHYISDFSSYHHGDYNQRYLSGGYGNTTNAVDAIQFSMSSGNIDSGDILLYGVN